MTATDELGETTVHRQYQADSQSVQVDATWYAGDTDKPTTLAFSGNGTSDYRVVFNNFQIPFSGNLAKYNTLSTQNKEYMGANTLATKEIAPPTEQYLALSGKLTWTEHPTIITWDVAPQKIRVVTDPDNGYIAALEFVYDADAKPTLTTLNFDGVDVELKWPYRVANNIVTKGVYGAGGFDPTYVCGSEGLGTAALAAAAYIFEKYEHPLANQAKELALQASRSAYNASRSLNHTPSFYLDRAQAAYFLCLMGYQAEFVPIGDYYGQYVLREQQANGDGSTNWFDGRMPLTMQVLDEIVDSADYANALKWYLTSITYYDDHLEYKGQSYTGGSFSGAGEIGYLAHMGDAETMAKVMNLTPENYDDTGASASSDLNPYFLGWSLKGIMNVEYDVADLRIIVKKGQSVLYDADGNVEILDTPTAYINNPLLLGKATVVYGDVDCDDKVTAADALEVLKSVVGKVTLNDQQFANADTDGNGKIDATDALNILKKVVGKIDKFPAEQ